ncbi:hypothetical protein LCGC14_1449010 [marine sediment metagenome]|uniref:Uncharacterized protein n=1 Tax=marine sediment metagenome TaxID=412755 RepID=A0A0F9LYX0_9ZZZZ
MKKIGITDYWGEVIERNKNIERISGTFGNGIETLKIPKNSLIIVYEWKKVK